MIEIHVDPSWTSRFPGARMGLLEARGLPGGSGGGAGLEAARLALEADLRNRYGGQDRKTLRANPALHAFSAYFKAHDQTYPVLMQLESVASKGRAIPSKLGAVTALFMAELKHGLVAAGHDLAKLRAPLRLAASQGGERYTGMNGAALVIPPGDMILLHEEGVLSSVLQGPDQHTPISPETRDALYTIYAPAEVPASTLEAQLEDLASNVLAYAPMAILETKVIPGA